MLTVNAIYGPDMDLSFSWITLSQNLRLLYRLYQHFRIFCTKKLAWLSKQAAESHYPTLIYKGKEAYQGIIYHTSTCTLRDLLNFFDVAVGWSISFNNWTPIIWRGLLASTSFSFILFTSWFSAGSTSSSACSASSSSSSAWYVY